MTKGLVGWTTYDTVTLYAITCVLVECARLVRCRRTSDAGDYCRLFTGTRLSKALVVVSVTLADGASLSSISSVVLTGLLSSSNACLRLLRATNSRTLVKRREIVITNRKPLANEILPCPSIRIHTTTKRALRPIRACAYGRRFSARNSW